MKSILKNFIFNYQRLLSPLFKSLGWAECRFVPTCSEYTLLAVGKHGIFKGLALSLKRVLRCRPSGALGADYP